MGKGEDVVRLYVTERMSTNKIAAHYGTDVAGIRRMLMRRGVVLRHRGRQLADPTSVAPIVTMWQWRREGASYDEIAERAGCSRDYAWTRLQRFGMLRRALRGRPRPQTPRSEHHSAQDHS